MAAPSVLNARNPQSFRVLKVLESHDDDRCVLQSVPKKRKGLTLSDQFLHLLPSQSIGDILFRKATAPGLFDSVLHIF